MTKNKSKLDIDLPLATLFSLEHWVSSVTYEDELSIKEGGITTHERRVYVHTPIYFKDIHEYTAAIEDIVSSKALVDKQYKFKKAVDGGSVTLEYVDGNNKLCIFLHVSYKVDDDDRGELLSEISGCHMVKVVQKNAAWSHDTWVCESKK